MNFDGGFYFMLSHLTIFAKPCAAFSCASTWMYENVSSSNYDEWGTLVNTDSISSGAQSRPTKTGHPTRAYCSNKFSAGCCLTLHIGNTIPHNFPSMTQSDPVNSYSNRRRSSANAFADLFPINVASVPRVASAATWARARARGAGLSRTSQNTATCPV